MTAPDQRRTTLAHTLEATVKEVRQHGTLAAQLAHDFNTDGLPAAQSYDGDGRGNTVVWCDTHQREQRVCALTCRDHDRPVKDTDCTSSCRALACTGIPLPRHTDRTGDTALEHRDPTDELEARLRHVELQLARACNAYVAAVKDITRLHTHGVDALPDEKVRTSLGAYCLACDRYVAGGASDPIRKGLCNACATWVIRWRQKNNDDRQDAIRARREHLEDQAELDRSDR